MRGTKKNKQSKQKITTKANTTVGPTKKKNQTTRTIKD